MTNRSIYLRDTLPPTNNSIYLIRSNHFHIFLNLLLFLNLPNANSICNNHLFFYSRQQFLVCFCLMIQICIYIFIFSYCCYVLLISMSFIFFVLYYASCDASRCNFWWSFDLFSLRNSLKTNQLLFNDSFLYFLDE